jgi:hypothetical protein
MLFGSYFLARGFSLVWPFVCVAAPAERGMGMQSYCTRLLPLSSLYISLTYARIGISRTAPDTEAVRYIVKRKGS